MVVRVVERDQEKIGHLYHFSDICHLQSSANKCAPGLSFQTNLGSLFLEQWLLSCYVGRRESPVSLGAPCQAQNPSLFYIIVLTPCSPHCTFVTLLKLIFMVVPNLRLFQDSWTDCLSFHLYIQLQDFCFR